MPVTTSPDETRRISVDVIDDLLYVGAALSATAQGSKLPVSLHRIESSWISYIAEFDEAAGVVIVGAELQDHVPTVLKVRALSAIGAVPLVLADRPSEAHVQRLMQAGAYRILTRRHSFEDLQETLVQLAEGSELEVRHPAPAATAISDVRLSDRELQVSSFYVGRAAPSASVIAELLGLPLASVRTYLQRTRSALQSVGTTSNRESLRKVLIADGWIDATK